MRELSTLAAPLTLLLAAACGVGSVSAEPPFDAGRAPTAQGGDTAPAGDSDTIPEPLPADSEGDTDTLADSGSPGDSAPPADTDLNGDTEPGGDALPADETPPTLALEAPLADAVVGAGLLLVSGTGSDDRVLEVVQVHVGAASFSEGDYLDATGTSTWSLHVDTSALADGEQTVTVRALDAAGNEIVVRRAILVDKSVPLAELAGLPANPSNSTSASITVSGGGVLAYRYSLDGGSSSAEVGVGTPITLTNLGNGSHTLSVVGRNAVPLWQESATSYTWTVDTVAPTASLSQTPPASTSSNTLNVDVGGSGVVNYLYRLDGAAWSSTRAANQNITASGLSLGAHSLDVRGIDAATNTQTVANATRVEWTVVAPTSGNVALGKPTSASSENDTTGTYAASKVVDGSTSGYWSSAWGARPGAYVEVDLQGWYSLSSSELLLGTSSTNGAEPDFELQYWDGCWQTIPGTAVVGNAATNVSVSQNFSSDVVTNRVRFMCTTRASGRCELRELRVFGVPVGAPTAPMTCPLLDQKATLHPSYAYGLFLPQGYNADRGARWPIIFAYHGIGGTIVSSDYSSMSGSPEGLANRLKNTTFRTTLPAIVVSPHCRSLGVTSGDCWFNNSAMKALFDDVLNDYLVDTDRVVLTGLSGGGIRGWSFVVENRERISAFVPVCANIDSGYDSYSASPAYDPVPAANGRHFCDLKAMPIWGFHGTTDSVVAYNGGHATKALDGYMANRCDAPTDQFIFNEADYAGSGHPIWNPVYARTDIYPWMLEQRISDRPAP